ncbi:rod shape-determining protein MreD [Paenibacillus pini]|uniref:Rod shape-determining protein MreD n=1 Tax=Paenibacillus pini JCM 16418 TaxID=1236976 RepID=W7Z6U5_9BACL|nr:rod shape-determining protein MreD [Paenibacillus pini]GAF10039.1 rod shape-determining protein MreD [Paenibacillus pini JCM 16418]
MVRKQVLILLLFLLFILEGALMPWLLPGSWQSTISPNLVFIVLLFVSVYHHRHTALILGIVFGLIHDVVYYGDMIGPYSFVMGFSAYIMGFIFQTPRAPMPLMMTVVILGSLLFDSMLFGIYRVFSLTQISYNWSLLHHILPDLIVHFVFGLLIYVPLRKELEQLSKRVKREKAA